MLSYVQIIKHGKFDLSSQEGREKERLRNVALTAISAMISKVFTMTIPLITVRLTLSYLGVEIYGLWNTVTAFFAMFVFADLGLGNGLITELSKATATDDKYYCKKIISSCYLMLLMVSIVLLLMFFLTFPFIDWENIVNAQSEIARKLSQWVVFVIFITQIIKIPIAIIEKTEMAMQEGYRFYLWTCLGSVLSLFFIALVCIFDLGKLTMIVLYATSPLITSFINMVYYFGVVHKDLRPSLKFFDFKISKKLFSIGIQFAILAIFSSLSLSIDNFIVAQVSSLKEVAPYSIFSRLASVIGAMTMMLSSPMWSANGEAMERGDFIWVRKTTRKISIYSVFIAIFSSIALLVLLDPILLILTDNEISANYVIIIGMCALHIIIAFTNPYFMILNGAGIVKFQIVNYCIYAALSLPLKFYLGVKYGVNAVIWTGVGSYLILLTIPTLYKGLSHLKSSSNYNS